MNGISKRTETVVLVASYIILVAANILGEVLKFGGVTAADVSNEVFAWFAPAGYVFSIWSVIYIGLAIWVVRLIKDETDDASFAGLPIGFETMLFAATCVLNIAWLAFWHLRVFPATIPVIVLLLAAVVLLYLKTRQRSEAWLDRVPIALYASWVAVATIANIAHVVTRNTVSDAGIIPAFSTILLLLLLAGLAFLVRKALGEYIFGIVVAWAGIGIGVRLVDVSPAIGVLAILISTIGIAAVLVPWNSLLSTQKSESRRSSRRNPEREQSPRRRPR